MSRGQDHQPLTLGGEERTAANLYCAGARLNNPIKGGIEFAHRRGFHDQHLAPNVSDSRFDGSHLQIAFQKIWVQQCGDDGGLGNQLVQQPQPLGRHINRGKGHARDVAARPVETRTYLKIADCCRSDINVE
jgi:hypothetical protein